MLTKAAYIPIAILARGVRIYAALIENGLEANNLSQLLIFTISVPLTTKSQTLTSHPRYAANTRRCRSRISTLSAPKEYVQLFGAHISGSFGSWYVI